MMDDYMDVWHHILVCVSMCLCYNLHPLHKHMHPYISTYSYFIQNGAKTTTM